ncbi:hypothetical protein DENSPDRAFT_844659 [Dentipellis sp. KUC8613]|nr:hypothetical protein DENSPDRAFT_844659 [Dentipellis sp. KUC8613]
MSLQLSDTKKRSASPSFHASARPPAPAALDIDVDDVKPRSSKKPRMKVEVVIERSSSRTKEKGKHRASIVPKVEPEEDQKVPIKSERVTPDLVATDSKEIPKAGDSNDRSDEAWASANVALSAKIKLDIKKGLELDAATVQTRIDAVGRDPFLVALDPAIRDTWVSRAFISAVFGGNSVAAFPSRSPEKIAKHGLDNFFFLSLGLHPHAPREPGQPGLWFDSMPYDWGDEKPFYTFVRLRSNDWLYFGQYRIFKSPSSSQQEWLLQPTKVRNKWARYIWEKPWGWQNRARITFRRDEGREPTDDELDDALAAKRSFKEITWQDVRDAYDRGEELLAVSAIKCVGYDEQFQRKISAEFPIWDEADRAQKDAKKKKKPPAKRKEGGQKTDHNHGTEDEVAITEGPSQRKKNVRKGAGEKKGKDRAAKRRADAESSEEDDDVELRDWNLDDDDDDYDGMPALASMSQGTRSRPRRSV